MEINIRITEKDLQENPAIFDIIKGFTVKEETPAEPAKAEFLEKRMNIPEPEEAPVAEPVEETPAEAEKPTKTETEEPEKKYTIEDIRVALSEMRDEKGIEEARGLLLKFGANKASDLKPEHYENFIKEAREV